MRLFLKGLWARGKEGGEGTAFRGGGKGGGAGRCSGKGRGRREWWIGSYVG